MTHRLVVSDFRYLQNSASGCAKTSFSDQKWLYFQSRLLSFKDIEHWRPPNNAPCKPASFTYQALNYVINIGGLNWGNRLAKTGTERASSEFSWNRYSWNGPKMEPFLTLCLPFTRIYTRLPPKSKIYWIPARFHNSRWMDDYEVCHGSIDAISILDPLGVEQAYSHIPSRHHSIQWHVRSHG